MIGHPVEEPVPNYKVTCRRQRNLQALQNEIYDRVHDKICQVKTLTHSQTMTPFDASGKQAF